MLKFLSSRRLARCVVISLVRCETRIRVDTVHQVKGESLDAVLYITTKEHAAALLAGVNSEVGRIGYVAVTRARNLLWVAIPANSLAELKPALLARGFQPHDVALSSSTPANLKA